jgi:hypothetical protein
MAEPPSEYQLKRRFMQALRSDIATWVIQTGHSPESSDLTTLVMIARSHEESELYAQIFPEEGKETLKVQSQMDGCEDSQIAGDRSPVMMSELSHHEAEEGKQAASLVTAGTVPKQRDGALDVRRCRAWPYSRNTRYGVG